MRAGDWTYWLDRDGLHGIEAGSGRAVTLAGLTPPPDYGPARLGDLMGTTALTGSMIAETPVKFLEYIPHEPPNTEVYDLIERMQQDIRATFWPNLFKPAPKPNK